MWNNLTMRERAAFMKVALDNGITDLEEIRNSYNEFAEGGKIHIKKENRGKFTESANRAGMGVQEFARHVLANKDKYSSTQVKRANFARNASKWHADGGQLFKENPFSKDPDFSNIETTDNRGYNTEYIDYINSALAEKGYDDRRRAVILGNIIEESGGDPFSVSDTGKYKGLLQWGPDRFIGTESEDPYREIDRQLDYLYSTIDNIEDQKSWTHGGKGSGYAKGKDAHNMFRLDLSPIEELQRAFSYGYVRPRGKEASMNNRMKVVDQVFNRIIGNNYK